MVHFVFLPKSFQRWAPVYKKQFRLRVDLIFGALR